MDRGPYNSHTMLSMLQNKYGTGVKPHTMLRAGERNAHLAGSRHPVTGVVFDTRGFPIFEPHVVFETRITESLSARNRIIHMSEATKNLNISIRSGQVSKTGFTSKQLAAIEAGAPKIPELTWHHHQETGRMQLTLEGIHNKTGHVGGIISWF